LYIFDTFQVVKVDSKLEGFFGRSFLQKQKVSDGSSIT